MRHFCRMEIVYIVGWVVQPVKSRGWQMSARSWATWSFSARASYTHSAGCLSGFRPPLLSGLLRGICDVAIDLSALTTHCVVGTAASPVPSPSICSVLLLCWLVSSCHIRGYLQASVFLSLYLSTCVTVPLLSVLCWCLSRFVWSVGFLVGSLTLKGCWLQHSVIPLPAQYVFVNSYIDTFNCYVSHFKTSLLICPLHVYIQPFFVYTLCGYCKRLILMVQAWDGQK